MGNGKTETDRPVIGVDVGGTKVLAGVVGPTGNILGVAKRATKPNAGVEAVVDRIARTVREAAAAAEVELSDIAGVCSGAPGPLDAQEGVIRSAPNMPGWLDVPFARLLSEALDGLPVYLENDANLGALGEQSFGAGVGFANIVGIFVGTGIGGGLVLDGRLWRGTHKTAGEIGHLIVLADGPVCGCGNRGCLEALASRTAIERDILAGLNAGRASIVPEILARERRDRLTSSTLAEALRRGDSLVSEVMGRVQFYLGLAVASIINFIDPEIVIIGGGVTEALGEPFLEPIRPIAHQYALNKRSARDIKIVPAMLGDNSALLGAAVHARQRLDEAQAGATGWAADPSIRAWRPRP